MNLGGDLDLRSKKSSNKYIRHLQDLMMLGYALIIGVAMCIVSSLIIKKTDAVLKNKVTSLTASLNVQMKLNLESYLSRMEATAALAFSINETVSYDASVPHIDEYSALSTEGFISDTLFSLCSMENFVDYGIVYRNNRTIGKISNGTINLFGDKIFDDLSDMISRQRTNDGWYTGYNGDYKRIYYVKEIHDNAVLVISFYSAELANVFDNPETLSNMTIHLTDRDFKILYSSDEADYGELLPEHIRSIAQEHPAASVMDNNYLVTVNNCSDDWHVICSIPTSIILSEINELKIYIMILAFSASFLAAIIGIFFSLRITRPVDTTINVLTTKANIDQLTGILNKRSFEEFAQSSLSGSESPVSQTLILIDLDNFKGVNDTLGHKYGDTVLSGTGGILRRLFTSSDVVGRIGGDEFCVLLNSAPDDCGDDSYARQKCAEICEAFRKFYTGDDHSYKISASIGAASSPHDGTSFAELYANADKALYHSKGNGKDTYSFFTDIADKEEKE
jgi:diguanylate cyclase (GGDEF)-like protein